MSATVTSAVLTRATLKRGGQLGATANLLLASAVEDNGHKLVWSLLGESGRPRDFLYRRVAADQFLILSARSPCDATNLWRLESKDWAPELSVGDRLAFSLRLNATVSQPTPRPEDRPWPRGRRIALAQDAKAKGEALTAAAADWLGARLPGAALSAEHLTALGEAEVSLRPRTGGPHRFDPLLVEGLLTVTEPAALLRQVVAGIGRSRAYGFGLMLLRRA